MDVMDELEKTINMLEFYKKKPSLYADIKKLFNNVPTPILFNIMENTRLFNVFKRSECQKFLNVLDALDNIKDDNVLIFISELQLYGIFDTGEYLEFTKKLCEMFDEDNIKSSTYQVVLNNSRQKLVFLCTMHDVDNNNTITTDKIAKHVKDFLGSTINTEENNEKIEITVDKVVEGNAKTELFDELFNYIHKRDEHLADRLSMMRVYRNREYKYSIPKLKNVTTMDELLLVLKTAHNVTINNLVINNGNHNVVNIPAAPIDKKSSTRDWILNNPPKEKESTTDYYKRYTAGNNNVVKANIFGPIARKIIGHEPVQGTGGIRRW